MHQWVRDDLKRNGEPMTWLFNGAARKLQRWLDDLLAPIRNIGG